MAVLFALLGHGASAPATKPVLRVCIIGSGISGAASTFFLQEQLADVYDLRLTVFERDHRVGGRIADVRVGSHRLEMGGSILHASNQYMRRFATVLNLTLQEPPPKLDGRVGVWDGHEFVLRLGGQHWLWDAATIFWRYHFDFMRLEQIVRNVAKNFTSVYALQEQRRQVFDSPRALLEALGLWEHTQMSLHQFLHTQREWTSGCKRHEPGAEQILDELAVAATRVNYNQDLDINALAGAVGLIPLTDSRLWAVEDGNARIIEGLFARAGADVRTGHSVRLVERVDMQGDNPESGHLRVHGRRQTRKGAAEAASVTKGTAEAEEAGADVPQSSASDAFTEDCDVVIVATALELALELQFRIPKRGGNPASNGDSSAESTNDDSSAYFPQPLSVTEYPRSFQTTHATFLAGRLRGAAFGLPLGEQPPATILTTESDELTFTSIAAYATFEEQKQDGKAGGEEADSTGQESNENGEQQQEQTQSEGSPVQLEAATPAPASPPARHVYKVFSRLPLTRSRVESLFEDVVPSATVRTAWRAYPRSSVPEEFLPRFALYPQVLYPSALEPAASCMEMQAVAAHNVAAMIARDWKEKIEREELVSMHDEL